MAKNSILINHAQVLTLCAERPPGIQLAYGLVDPRTIDLPVAGPVPCSPPSRGQEEDVN